jgi:3-oxoacyl-[acyl-carrier protein] reductase
MRCLISGVSGNVGAAVANLIDRSGGSGIGLYLERKPDLPGSFQAIYGDVTNFSLIGSILSREAPFDLAVMAHGVQRTAKLSEVRRSDIDFMLDVNLKGSLYLAAQLIQENKINKGGLIVFCSSIQATTPREGRILYATAKAGLEGLTRALAVELAGAGIRVIALRLGQLSKTMRGVSFSPEQTAQLQKRAPLGWLEPELVAKLILALYDQPKLSGEVITFDGLQTLNTW